MNVGALFQQHKRTLAFAGAAAAAGLGLLQARKRDTGGDAAAVAAPSYSTGGGPVSSSPISGGFAPYDSTASDITNALQPQIEYLQRLAEQQAQAAIPVSTPADETPEPAAAPAPYRSPAAGLKAGFYKAAGSSNLYRIQNGTIDYLTRAEFTAMTKGTKGTPKVTTISKDSPVFANGAHWLDARKQK